MSIVARASPGTVLAESPAFTVVTTDVMSGRSSTRLSIRMISRASAETALRPSAVSAPAWAGRPCRWSVRQSAPLRAETRSPFRRPHSKTSAAAASRACSATAGGRGGPPPTRPGSGRRAGEGRGGERLLIGADQEAQRGEGQRGQRRKPLERHRGEDEPALHVRDARAGAEVAVAPERPPRRRPGREDGVGVAEQRDRRPAVAG